jgi:pyruvate kinase
MLHELVGAGVDVFRLNMAHGNRGEHEAFIERIREAARAGERPVGILVDLAGPKIRLGELPQDPLTCRRDSEFRFVRGEAQGDRDLTSSYDRLVDELDVDDVVLLADGTVEMVVIAKEPDAVTCRVVGPGLLRSRQGINLPGVKLSIPTLGADDRDHAKWAAQQGADFVSLSFVRAAGDIHELKQLLREEGSEALAIAKIEKPEAIANLVEIIRASDGIMVARGDLGVEIDVAEMPVVQKRIIETCQRWKKPVIVATQMLDSMQRASHPTRAEVTDVANAILDGADACMLSGETAVGSYPLESVRMMNRIMISTEKALQADQQRRQVEPFASDIVHPITSAVVTGASQIAQRLKAKLVVIVTRSGNTALAKAKYHDFSRTVAVSENEATLRHMCLYWGIQPLQGAPPDLERGLIPFIDDWGRRMGLLERKDCVVLVTGTNVVAAAHNQVVVHEVE